MAPSKLDGKTPAQRLATAIQSAEAVRLAAQQEAADLVKARAAQAAQAPAQAQQRA